jgi:hypothetical protein
MSLTKEKKNKKNMWSERAVALIPFQVMTRMSPWWCSG